MRYRFLGLGIKMLAFGFGIGWIIEHQYPNINPAIIFFPIIILGAFLDN